MRALKNVIIIVVAVALLGIGINAFAHSGMSWGGGWGHHGPGWHHRSGYGPNAGELNQLSTEDYQALEEKRAAFFAETRELRARLYEKEGELQKEMTKETPDVTKASALQKEISEMQAQFDQKRIDHMVEMRKINPQEGRGKMFGAPMKGKGFYGRGYCWE